MKVLSALFFLVLPLIAFSQTKAVTEKGQEVILYDNGTWKYVDAESAKELEIPISSKKYSTPKDATFLVKSSVANVGVYIDPKKWSFKKAGEEDASEFKFEMKEKDGYAMMITERIEVSLESLKEVALTNAREAAPDIELSHQEYRMVNGNKVLCLQMNGTLSGIRFSYFGYYFSSEKGTVQFITYTSQNLMNVYKTEFEDLLNGFVVVQ